MAIKHISSPDNPLFRLIRRLNASPTAYRQEGKIWIEGEHLCRSCLDGAAQVHLGVVSQSAWEDPAQRSLWEPVQEVVIVPDAQFARISALPSPAGVGLLIEAASNVAVDPVERTVVLDGVQDAGNVGSILRSAAALGVQQVVALPGTAGLWSPKVTRAGMGAHFALRLVEVHSPDSLSTLKWPLVATSSHATMDIWDEDLPIPCNWLFGHEGRGVSQVCQDLCHATVRIPQPGGQESLNVAAAAAVCLYESLRRSRDLHLQ